MRQNRNRNSTQNKNYKADNRQLKNKKVKMERTLKAQPNNKELSRRYNDLF